MDLRGIPFTYRHTPGGETPVLLLPGLTGRDWIWGSTLATLDEAGHGTVRLGAAVAELDLAALTSGNPAITISEVADIALAILDELSIERVVVCGNSLGALLALDFAARHPERTAGMVFSGCPGMGEKIIDTSFVVSHNEREVLEEFRGRMFENEPDWVRPLMEEAVELALPRSVQLKMLKLVRAANMHETLACVPRVACRTCVIWGELDRITPLAGWQGHLGDFRDAEVHIVEGCGHSPMLEAPDRWRELLLGFVERIDSGRQEMAAAEGTGALSAR